MSKRQSIKSTALTITFNDKHEVNAAIAEMGMAQRERDRLQVAMNEELAQVKLRYEELAQPHAAIIKEFGAAVQNWCEANRVELTRGGKKTVAFGAGEVSWRMRPPSVTVRSQGIVIELLKKLGLQRWLRTKEEIDKNAILADPNAAQLMEGIKGLAITQGEDFVIKPFASQIEEVQP